MTLQSSLKRAVFPERLAFSPTPVGEDDDQHSWQVGYTRAWDRCGPVPFAMSGRIPSPNQNLTLGDPAPAGSKKGGYK